MTRFVRRRTGRRRGRLSGRCRRLALLPLDRLQHLLECTDCLLTGRALVVLLLAFAIVSLARVDA